jgi:hypothetical protein
MRSPTAKRFYHEASGDRKLRRTLRQEAAAYALSRIEVKAAAYATLARLSARTM